MATKKEWLKLAVDFRGKSVALRTQAKELRMYGSPSEPQIKELILVKNHVADAWQEAALKVERLANGGE